VIIQVAATDKLIDCWEAESKADQARGLMGVPGLEPYTGLLFIYDDEELRTFSMPSQMLFAIDMVFIGDNGLVTEVFEFCQPGETDPETGAGMLFQAPARWVVEIAAGEAKRLGMLPGVQINFDDDGEGGML
jgi:uncharacterized protein